MLGGHCLKTWSSTQKNITLSSGEAELVAAVKVSTEVLGILQLSGEWGCEMTGHIFADSSAAIGMVKRKGNGKMRHIRIGQLWIQQKSEDGDLQFVKVSGEANPADLMTKYLAEKVAMRHMEFIGQTFVAGRSDLSLRI